MTSSTEQAKQTAQPTDPSKASSLASVVRSFAGLIDTAGSFGGTRWTRTERVQGYLAQAGEMASTLCGMSGDDAQVAAAATRLRSILEGGRTALANMRGRHTDDDDAWDARFKATVDELTGNLRKFADELSPAEPATADA